MNTHNPPTEADEQMGILTKFALVAIATVAMTMGAFALTARADVLPATVTINKYIDGVQATAATASSANFPMSASWVIGGTPGGPASYALSASGFNGNPTPYQAMTAGLNMGDDYATSENTTGTTVGTVCTENPTAPAFALVGYTSGSTHALAASGTPTLTPPAFTNLSEDKYVIVWNHSCAPIETPDVTVSIHKFIEGTHATALSATSAAFPMNASWTAGNIGAGSGTYSLDTTNTPNIYEAKTVAMSSGANYATDESLTGIVGIACTADTAAPAFALTGYTVGDSYADAMAATQSMTSPALTNITTSKHVIVWNHDCTKPTGTIGGDVGGGAPHGVLAVTSVQATDTSAVADGTFENGWKFVFNVTVPNNETHLAMKFADWLRAGGGGTIPVASNMRISSLQADNGNATVLLTAANTYTTPTLHITGDLDLVTPGLQVQVTVDTAVPVATPNGSYTTTYGTLTN